MVARVLLHLFPTRSEPHSIRTARGNTACVLSRAPPGSRVRLCWSGNRRRLWPPRHWYRWTGRWVVLVRPWHRFPL
jgi:hypothetical protein